MTEKIKVLFVCLGNICRSPTAQGVFEKMVKDAGVEDRFEIDSAGTAAYHIGSKPDPRSIAHAQKRGYELDMQRARKVSFDDFYHYDYILAMDRSNYDDLIHLAPNDCKNKIHLVLEYGHSKTKEVPDPYSGGDAGFEKVLDLLEDACKGFMEKNSVKAELYRQHQS